MADRTVTVHLRADTAQYQAGMVKASGATTGVNTALGKQSAAAATGTKEMGKLGAASGVAAKGFSAVGLGAVGAGAGVAMFAKGSIDAARDLEETLNKVDVVFGDSADTVLAFGETAADSFGMSENAADSAAAVFGQFFDAAGMSSQAAADMSVEMTSLGADLASFNNIPTDVALEKIRSGLAGEVEPLRTVGVFLNEAAVKAKAMEMGLGSANGELTEGEKIQARYALILEQTTKAQGDFARTSGSLANQQRTLSAEVEDLQAEIGEFLIPIMSDLTGVAIDVTRALGDVAEVVISVNEASKSWTSGHGLIAAIQGSIPGLGAMKQGAESLGSAMEALGLKTEEATEVTTEQQFAMDQARLATYIARGGSSDFEEQTEQTAEAVEDQTKALEDLRDQYFKTMNAALGLSDATIGYEQALDDATEAVDEIDKGTEGFARTLDINTQAGRDNQAALDDIASAALGVTDQMYATGASEAEVTAKNATMRNSLYNAALQFGMTEQEAHEYTDRVLGIPPKADTTANFYSGAAEGKIATYMAKLKSLPKEVESNIKATYTFRYQGGTGGMGGPQSALGSGNRVFPLPGGKGAYPITQGLHPVNAIDYGVRSGTPLYASFNGTLTTANLGNRSYGKYYRLEGSGQRPILVAHLSNFARGSGPIAQGALIGWTGASGNATGPHAHIENFDEGGWLAHGGLAQNLSGRPERILNPAQTESFDKLVTVLAGGRNAGATYVVNVHVSGSVTAERDLARTIENELHRFGRRGDVLPT